jgi:hypothetical protein
MNTENLFRLQKRLRRRAERILQARKPYFIPKVKRFWEFLHAEPVLAGILQELQRSQFTALNKAQHIWTTGSLSAPKQPAIVATTTEAEHAAVAHQLLRFLTESEDDFENVERNWYGDTDPGSHHKFKDEVVVPLCDFLEEALDERDAVLGFLVRYKKRCEWFSRDELYQRTREEGEKDYAQIEEVLKNDLYRYLHDQGVNFTIEPYSVKGKIDLILDQKGAKPLHIEVKVFDDERRDQAYLRSGISQLLIYMDQHNTTIGYLTIYKTCESILEFGGDGQTDTIPFLQHHNKWIFVLIVDLFPHTKPVSQRVDCKRIMITCNDLLG